MGYRFVMRGKTPCVVLPFSGEKHGSTVDSGSEPDLIKIRAMYGTITSRMNAPMVLSEPTYVNVKCLTPFFEKKGKKPAKFFNATGRQTLAMLKEALKLQKELDEKEAERAKIAARGKARPGFKFYDRGTNKNYWQFTDTGEVIELSCQTRGKL